MQKATGHTAPGASEQPQLSAGGKDAFRAKPDVGGQRFDNRPDLLLHVVFIVRARSEPALRLGAFGRPHVPDDAGPLFGGRSAAARAWGGDDLVYASTGLRRALR